MIEILESLFFRQRLPNVGVILFRLGEESMDVKRSWLERVLIEYPDRLGDFIVITDHGVRIRGTSK